jgi:hypothetical protein
MDKNGGYRLEVMYEGKWRKLWYSDNRKELAEYIELCPETEQLRIMDTLEEEVNARGRRH